MAGKKTGGYGSWSSPITADAVAAEAVPLSEPSLMATRRTGFGPAAASQWPTSTTAAAPDTGGNIARN